MDYLFCYKDTRIGDNFINTSLIPALCAKAGVESKDARGRISGHRGRSTRLTLLRQNGVGLDDLAEYAGHKDSTTIRRYARHNPLQLHRIIKDADDVSRIIEGIVDVRAAGQGLPALRWFIGYDPDGAPQYCANQVYHTCPHRLDCPKCGMFIGGEQARLLHEGENRLPITSKVPMTPVEKCVVNGDDAGVATCQEALKEVPAPEAPDIRLIFNPEGLSNRELEQLAQIGTCDGWTNHRQALTAHERRLAEAQQHKTGRSALVGAQKKQISFIEDLIVQCGVIFTNNKRANMEQMKVELIIIARNATRQVITRLECTRSRDVLSAMRSAYSVLQLKKGAVCVEVHHKEHSKSNYSGKPLAVMNLGDFAYRAYQVSWYKRRRAKI